MRTYLLIPFALSIVFAACGTSGGDDGDDGSNPPPSYSNHVKLECDNQVLVDRTFTSKAECDSYAASHEFTCHTIKLPISC
jgi:hypothetical protein